MNAGKQLFLFLTGSFLILACIGPLQAAETQQKEMNAAKFKQQLKQLDQNKDGRISREEFSGPDEKFNKLDLDADGFITQEELRTVLQKVRDARSSAPQQEADSASRP